MLSAGEVLHEFLTTNRQVLVERCRLRAAERLAPKVTDAELMHGIPAFLDQLIETLLVEQSSEPLRSRKVSGPAGGGPAVSEIGTTAALHGRELSLQGFTVEHAAADRILIEVAVAGPSHSRVIEQATEWV